MPCVVASRDLVSVPAQARAQNLTDSAVVVDDKNSAVPENIRVSRFRGEARSFCLALT